MDFDGIGSNEKKVGKALILAAGLGSRLAPITDNCPKSLVPVNGKPILFKQIENLHENGITEITIISGYKAVLLERQVHEIWPEINIICSVDYATTNNMYSAYLGRSAVEGKSFLMMNADVFYDASIIKALLSCDAPNAIATDIGRYLEESMKVVEKSGRLVKISKAIAPENSLGSSIDVYKFSAEGGKVFFNKCREYIEEKKELKLWSEVALNDILPIIEFKACPLVGRWIEIDNHDDLEEAEKLFL
ncbi:MAG: phosphocholine cytidylyltransferase family protein [Bacteroides thetaiotaomicron]|nr:phosphocholine cytidylyltransferase family protein [Bacteroides thetaiotaomicron]